MLSFPPAFRAVAIAVATATPPPALTRPPVSQLHAEDEDGSQQAAFELLNSYLTNVDMLMSNESRVRVDEAKVRQLAAAASAIRISHLWFQRIGFGGLGSWGHIGDPWTLRAPLLELCGGVF